MARAGASGQSLSHRDTCYVKGMILRGDRQHDIAAYYGVNSGRIAEVSTGDNDYPNAEPMDETELPPPGPYMTTFALRSVIDSLSEAIELIEMAEAEEQIDDVKAALMLARETLQEKIDQLKIA